MAGLRVIGGKSKGMRLKSVPGNITRPITDRVKESLFNILASNIIDTIWLDLFAGTGAVGIEALSRGASFITFIDNHLSAIKTVKANLELTGYQDQSEIIKQDAFKYLNSKIKPKYDIVYIAPPQYKDMWLKVLKLIDKDPYFLAEDGLVIVQIHPVEFSEVELTHLIEFDKRKYGSTLLVFYELQE